MTSVFYDVIRLESVRGRSNVHRGTEWSWEGHFLRFLGNLNPKMLSAIVGTPKRHFLTSQRVFWAMSREIRCTGYFSRRVREKNKNKIKIKREALYFTYFARRSITADCHKFWVTCSSAGPNELCNVLSLSVKGFGFYEWSKFDHSHWIAISPLTLCELLFTLWLLLYYYYPEKLIRDKLLHRFHNFSLSLPRWSGVAMAVPNRFAALSLWLVATQFGRRTRALLEHWTVSDFKTAFFHLMWNCLTVIVNFHLDRLQRVQSKAARITLIVVHRVLICYYLHWLYLFEELNSRLLYSVLSQWNLRLHPTWPTCWDHTNQRALHVLPNWFFYLCLVAYW